MSSKFFFFFLVLTFSFGPRASVVAVVDTGTDVFHRDLQAQILLNEGEIPADKLDNDKNQYRDDYLGWNFILDNDFVIDISRREEFSEDIGNYFFLQAKAMVGQANAEELTWLVGKQGDKAFTASAGKYATYMHGTHVAGIVLDNNSQGQVLALKLLATASSTFLDPKLKAFEKVEDFQLALKDMALAQVAHFQKISLYASQRGARVFNGSYGQNFEQGVGLIARWFMKNFKVLPSNVEMAQLTLDYFNVLKIHGSAVATSFPQMLYVFAAGNDGRDNDVFPIYPGNTISANTLSVAATIQDVWLAPFSNFGKKLVDLAAPGFYIKSTVPGDYYMGVSGTSQAAPKVSRIASIMIDENGALSGAQVKELLMLTVDKKDFLKDSVKSGGMANGDRAILAARFTSEGFSLAEAVSRAFAELPQALPEAPNDGPQSRGMNKIMPFDISLNPAGLSFDFSMPSPLI